MGCKFRERLSNGKSCKFFGKGYCNNQEAKYYRCVDYIARGKFKLSYSQKQSWERCPYKWYLENIIGIKKREEKKSPAMKMGSELGRLVSGIGEPERFLPSQEYNKQLCALMARIIKEYELLPLEGVEYEHDFVRDGFRGKIDMLVPKIKSFYELKFTTDPTNYTDKASATTQITGYFYGKPDYPECWIIPVRVSALKDKKGADPMDKLGRIEEDVKKRMNFYFPKYDPDREPPLPKWGTKFWIKEFDLVEFGRGVNWAKQEIMRSCEAMYFPQRTANCSSPFKCDFISVFETGGISWQTFERREQDDH
jgi:hypothetical protein